MELVIVAVAVAIAVVGIVALFALACVFGYWFRGEGPNGWKIEGKPPKK